MVTIIDPKPDKSVFKEVICRHCGVKLQYIPKDVRSRAVWDYGGGKDTYRWIDCPGCSYEVEVR
jgi:DNA-directed RNA polymerase subunit RPC12/RpoP